MPGSTFKLLAVGCGKALLFSTLGFVNRTQSLILASLQNKSTSSMRVRKRNYAPVGCKRSNNALLFHWFLLTPEGWQLTATGIIVDWLKKKKGS